MNGFPKKGTHSVGVARQWCGQTGKQDNCQVAVSLSVATEHASLPIAYRLYLPEEWANEPEARAYAGIPAEISFATKPQIALEQIRQARAAGVPAGVAVMDAGYGADTDFRDSLRAEGLDYVAGVRPNTSVWPEGTGPLPPKPYGGRGQPGKRLRRDADHQPREVEKLALSWPAEAWSKVCWREGVRGEFTSRFARMRVRAAHRDYLLTTPRPEEWLLVEWPESDKQPTKYWLSSLPEATSIEDLVDYAKARWLIERDYQELKQELGLGHFEGRGWRGFHHHASLCIAA